MKPKGSVLGKGNSICKGPGVGMNTACSKNKGGWRGKTQKEAEWLEVSLAGCWFFRGLGERGKEVGFLSVEHQKAIESFTESIGIVHFACRLENAL